MAFPGQQRRDHPQLVLCEQGNLWAVGFRRMLPAAIRVNETRTLAACRQALADEPSAVAALEWRADQAGSLLAWAWEQRQTSQTRFFILGLANSDPFSWAAREAGALHIIPSPRDLPQVKRLILRYFATTPKRTFATIEDEVVAGLPWGKMAGQSQLNNRRTDMTAELTVDRAINAMRDYKDPETGRSVVQMEQVSDVAVQGNSVTLTLALTTHSAPIWDELYDEAEQLLKARLPEADKIEVKRSVHESPAEKLGSIGLTAKSVIAVGSGKGGVGKSTVAASLALALQKAGARVGLLDADVFGPSIPTLTGTHATPEQVQGPERKLMPIDYNGMPVMSIGYLVPAEQAVVWRGPMLHSAVSQFLRDTIWGDLDYLIIDMPPGTGDIPLTLSQILPESHAVVVCTPQEVALIDAVKAITMFRTVNTPVLGMVENMSGFICPDCGKRYDIFGSGGAREKAEQMEVAFLGEIPLNMQIRINGDAGQVASSLEDPLVAPYLTKLAQQVTRRLVGKARTSPPGPSLPVLG